MKITCEKATLKSIDVILKEIEVLTIFLSKVMGSDGFCNGANLIYFQKQTIAGFFVNGHLNSFWVGNGQIVSNNLNISWTSQFCPSFPIILGNRNIFEIKLNIYIYKGLPYFENIQFPTSHFEAKNSFGLASNLVFKIIKGNILK